MRILSLCFVLALTACGPMEPLAPVESPRTETPQPSGPMNLRVDHVWVKDAAAPGKQAKQRAAVEALRVKAAAGESFTAAWQSLGIDGAAWHVAEGETYPSDVLPEGARDLAVGTLSPILPGNGGLHLFRILGREAVPE